LSQQSTDKILIILLRLMASLSGVITAIIVFFLIYESLPFFDSKGLQSLFYDSSWYPMDGVYNLIPMLSGSIFVMIGSIIVAAPIGLMAAIFSEYYAPKITSHFFISLINLLAGIPSVVFGLWGLVVLVPLINKIQPPGASLLAAIIVLSLMILPTVTLLSKASLAKVPKDYISAGQALGLTKWTIIQKISLPVSKVGIITSLILASGRAIGETMAVLMIGGNVAVTPSSLFDPVRTLTSNIALEMAYAMGEHRSALFISGLILTLFIILLLSVAELISKKGDKHATHI